jgi:hypothetical protein
MPAIGSSFDPDQEDTVEIRGRRMVLRMQSGNKAPHERASTDWE